MPEIVYTQTKQDLPGVVKPAEQPTPTVTDPNGPPPPKAPTPEELKARTRDVYKSMGWGEPPEEAPAAPAAPVEPAPAAPAAPATPATPAPAAPTEPPAAPSNADLITETARATALEMTRLNPSGTPPAAAPAPEPDLAMDEVDQESYRILSYMAGVDPARHGDKPARFLAFLKAMAAYRAQWEKDNPGKTFDPSDEEHNDWYEKNQPEDLDAAEIDKLKAKMEELERLKLKERLDRYEQEKVFAQHMPEIVSQVDRQSLAFVEAVSPDLAKLMRDAETGRARFTEQTLALADESDPIAMPIIRGVCTMELEPMVAELEKLAVPALRHRLDRGNSIHRKLLDFIDQKEKDLLAAPLDVRTREGRLFMTNAEYGKRVAALERRQLSPEEKQSQLEALRAQYWVLSVDELEELLRDFYVKKAKAIIEESDSRARKKYAKAGQAPVSPAPVPAPVVPAAPTPAPVPASSKPVSPSSTPQSASVAPSVPGTPGQKSKGEIAADINFR